MKQEEKKPREFWICDHGNWYDCRETAFDEQSQSALTHVIEYSAYEDLKAKLEKACEALRFYAQPAEIGNLDGEILMRPVGSYEAFKERKEVALAALKEIEGEK